METPFKILACLCSAAVISVTSGFGAQAAINLETDSSVAGVSVAMNNYYAGSLDPENELAEAFSSDETMEQVVKSGKEDAPTVKNPSSSSAYDNVAVSQVSNYVNVRSEASTKGSVVGKIYNNCAATILDTVDGEGGKWYKIQSGSVNGYIKAQYFITGAEAEKKARQVGTTYAKVANTSTLRLREEPSLDSKTLDLLSSDAEYEVIEEKGDFYKVSVDTDLVGYVFKDYVDTRVEFDHAVTNSEEEQKAAEESKRKEEAEKAQTAARALFSGQGSLENMPSFNLTDEDFTDGSIDILAVLQKSGLAPTRSEARRNVEQGGVSVNGEPVKDIKASYTKADFAGEGMVVKRGKKKFMKVTAE